VKLELESEDGHHALFSLIKYFNIVTDFFSSLLADFVIICVFVVHISLFFSSTVSTSNKMHRKIKKAVA